MSRATLTLVRSLSVFAAASFLTVSAAEAVGPLQYFSVAPCRLADTRDPIGVTGGPALSSDVSRHFAVYGANARACGIPADGTVRAVSVNVTISVPSNYGHLTLWPYNPTTPSAPPPVVSTLNFATGDTAIANGAIVEVAQNPSFQLSTRPFVQGGGGVHFILDITGYFKTVP